MKSLEYQGFELLNICGPSHLWIHTCTTDCHMTALSPSLPVIARLERDININGSVIFSSNHNITVKNVICRPIYIYITFLTIFWDWNKLYLLMINKPGYYAFQTNSVYYYRAQQSVPEVKNFLHRETDF